MIGWTANVFILIGLVLVAYKKRSGFLAGLIGNLLWCLKGVATQQHDLVAIEGIIVALQAFSWWNWGHARPNNRLP